MTTYDILSIIRTVTGRPEVRLVRFVSGIDHCDRQED